MAELSPQQLLELVNTTRKTAGDARARRVVSRIVTDLFRAIDELDISPAEFWKGVAWLTRLGASGQTGLITAGLGFDRLLDIRDEEKDHAGGHPDGTPRAIEGPLYIPDAPLATSEVRLDDEDRPGAAVLVMEGCVLDVEGVPLRDAIVDVWHCDEHGRYSHFDPSQKQYNLRRRIRVDVHGRYRFRSFLPPGYAIPPDSPTSELFSLLGRHGNRPAHIHFLVSAPGARTLTTQVNIPGDTFINDDFAFATRDGLIANLVAVESPVGYESLGITGPFTRIQFDFRLQPTAVGAQQGHLGREARARE
jgi:catechol 1,2-dioxygenase